MRDAGGCVSCSCPEEVPADLQWGFGGLVAWGGDGSSWQRCSIWWKLISPRVHRKPEDVIEFPVINRTTSASTRGHFWSFPSRPFST